MFYVFFNLGNFFVCVSSYVSVQRTRQTDFIIKKIHGLIFKCIFFNNLYLQFLFLFSYNYEGTQQINKFFV